MASSNQHCSSRNSAPKTSTSDREIWTSPNNHPHEFILDISVVENTRQIRKPTEFHSERIVEVDGEGTTRGTSGFRPTFNYCSPNHTLAEIALQTVSIIVFPLVNYQDRLVGQMIYTTGATTKNRRKDRRSGDVTLRKTHSFHPFRQGSDRWVSPHAAPSLSHDSPSSVLSTPWIRPAKMSS